MGEWLGITPAAPETIGGAFEAPELAGCLTLNKGDFIRTGLRGATYIAYRREIQAAVARQLAEWGDGPDNEDESRRRVARPLERDLENVLVDLAEDFPMLASLVEQRLGGQRKLPIYRTAPIDDAHAVMAASIAAGHGSNGKSSSGAVHDEPSSASGPESSESSRSDAMPVDAPVVPSAPGARRPGRYALGIQFESRAGDAELARLVESTVWVNDAHPAFRRAAASRSEGYHLALAVAMALGPLAVPPPEEHGFITAFLARWGAAVERPVSRRKSR